MSSSPSAAPSGGNWINSSTFQWTSGGLGMKVLNAELKVLSPERMKRTSTAVYSTPTSLTAIGNPKDPGELPIPPGLTAIPAGCGIQVTQGEVVLAMFDDQTVGDTFMLVNHQACATMPVTLQFGREISLLQTFDRATGLWDDMTFAGGASPRVSLTLAQGDGMLLRAVSNPLPADANLDGIMDVQDFGAVKSFFGGAGGWSQGDFNGDGLIDLQDFGTLKTYFGAQVSLVAVPEPGGGILAGAAALALLRRRAR
jgi:hypothetical protein